MSSWRRSGARPSRYLLARSIGAVVARLELRELTQLRVYLTAPHWAIAFKVREAIKDVLLGRDQDEGREL